LKSKFYWIEMSVEKDKWFGAVFRNYGKVFIKFQKYPA
jgi:hypothetical protein